MCGIAGFWGGRLEESQALNVLRCMGEAIKYRGPDDAGVWFDITLGIGMSHRRLSIVDLSAAGHQPMPSASGRYVMTFNGEIYNHLQLRTELNQSTGNSLSWRGHSDTETLLSGFECWGFEPTLRRAVGMFAIALWDREQRTLTLARDRLGEKPLYYGMQGGVLLFGSELKSLRAHPAFAADVDRGALALYLRHSCVPSPYSIYQGIYKVPPGSWLQLDARALVSQRLPEPSRYWSIHNVVADGIGGAFEGSDEDAVNALEQSLMQAVRLQQVADVPLGAFLSGGVDSSTVVALMQVQSSCPVKTFTIGFSEKGFNEADHAKAVAKHLGTEHTELYITPDKAQDVIPRLPLLYDEPFADTSQIPTFLVAGLARKHVAVSLSGDAGDELFGGYNRYLLARSVWKKISVLPQSLRNLLARVMGSPSPQAWNLFYGIVQGLLPAKARLSQPGDKLHKLAEIVSSDSPETIYQRLSSHWKAPASVVIGGREPATWLNTPQSWPATGNFEHWMMAMDMLTYLSDDILVKVDRAAMGVSLETRVPFLDHRVVELVWRMPLHMKIRNGQGKWLLRQVLYRHVPRELIERPKMGFSVPIDSWLRGSLRDWAEDLLSEHRLIQEGFFNHKHIRQKWTEHLSGRHNWQYYLWDVLMFQVWLEKEKQA